MLIQELINNGDTKGKLQFHFDPPDPEKERKYFEPEDWRDQGISAHVKPHSNQDRHMVTRTEWAFGDPDDNVYYQMVKIISKYRTNPYLPRVRVLKSETNPKGEYKFTYEIERLRDPLKMRGQLDKTIIDRIGNRMFYHWERLASDYDFLTPWEQLAAVLEYVVDNHMNLVLQDPLLIQAIEILKEVKERHGRANWDISSKNIMIRLTSTGPQPVFTDILHY